MCESIKSHEQKLRFRILTNARSQLVSFYEKRRKTGTSITNIQFIKVILIKSGYIVLVEKVPPQNFT